MIRIKVQWKNATNRYLQNPDCELPVVSGAVAVVKTVTTGNFRVFEVTGTAGNVVRLELKFRPPMISPPATVFNLVQQLRLTSATELTKHGSDSLLVEIKKTSQAGVAGAELTVLTDFVDIQELWMARGDKFVPDGDIQTFIDIKESGWDLRAFAHTGGMPHIWLTLATKEAVDLDAAPDNKVPVFVYFRHENFVDKGDLPRPGEPLMDFSRLNTVILSHPGASPGPPDPSLPEHNGLFFRKVPGNFVNFLFGGFGRALMQSRRYVVLVFPWPIIESFGSAETAELPDRLHALLRFMRSNGLVAQRRGLVDVGRIALGGYSSSGHAVANCVSANRGRISEVYWFDADYGANGVATLASWINRGAADARLRMVAGGIGGTANKQVADQVADKAKVVLYPPQGDERYWDPAGRNAWYDMAIGPVPAMRTARAKDLSISARHNFALQGGESDFDPSTGLGRTFFEEFLSDSGFPLIIASSGGGAPAKWAKPPDPLWKHWPREFADGARGALILPNPASPGGSKPSRAFFSKGLARAGKPQVGHYIGVDTGTKTLATGDNYPASVKDHWPNWPDAKAGWGDAPIDACVHFRAPLMAAAPMAYFFKGDEYLSYDPHNNVVIGGPIKMNAPGSKWRALPWSRDIDAVIEWDLKTAYFFRDGQVVQWNIEHDLVVRGPEPIANQWPNMPASFRGRLHAAVRWPDGKVYFFRGNQYLEYISPGGVAPGYPRTIIVP